jgi:RimJ/RimL family protein N-acetyltransferase
MITTMADDPVRLRPFREEDLDVIVRSATDPAFSLPFEWGGYRSVPRLRARWEEDRFLEKDPHHLAVVEGDGPARCGFEREGVLRQGGWRGGAWRDVCLYGRLRE